MLTISAVRVELGEEAFAAAYEEGRSLTPRTAVARVLLPAEDAGAVHS